MSMVFMARFGDLKYTKGGEGRVAKESTVKIVLLAFADHANGEGQSTYPSYSLLEIKTGLSRQGLADTIEALRQNEFLIPEGRTGAGTISYRINLGKLADKVVKPLDYHQSSGLTGGSQATRLKPSINPSEGGLGGESDPVMNALDRYKIDYKRYLVFLGEMIDDWKRIHPDEWILEAIRISAGKSVKYVDAILSRWEQSGYPERGSKKEQPPRTIQLPQTALDFGDNAISASQFLEGKK